MKIFSRLDSNKDVGLLFLRVGFGSLMFLHGMGKLADLISGKTTFFDNFDPLGLGPTAMLSLAVLAEFFGALLVVVGLFTRLAAVPLISTMTIAFFIYHAEDELFDKEQSLLFLIGFICIFLLGPGKYSLDQKFLMKK